MSFTIGKSWNAGLAMASLILMMSACATGGAKHTSSDGYATTSSDRYNPGREDEIVCQIERTVGSNIAERVCRYVNAAERERNQTQAMIRDLNRSAIKPPESGPGPGAR